MKFASRVAPIALGLLVGSASGPAAAVQATKAAIDRYALPFEAKARIHESAAVYANFSGDGMHYARYASEKAFVRARAAFLAGPAPGGGSFVARTYRVAGSRGLYVTFEPGVQNSLAERERIVFDGSGYAIRLHEEVESYNGYYRTVRDAYFSGGKPLVDRTIRYDFSPGDASFRHPLKASKAVLDEMTIPAYEMRAKLPFSA